MKISKELIEKYHEGKCTSEEKEAVEAWLLDDDSDTESLLPLPVGATELRDDMWKEIATALPQHEPIAKQAFFNVYRWQVAAVFLIALTGFAVLYFNTKTAENELIVVNNTSETINKDLNENAYTISLGPKSNVEINNESGRISFCGSMMINPKRDIEWTIHATCASPDDKSEKMILKKGQQYIALNYGTSANANEVLILPQGSLDGLPPLVQRQLMKQFNI